MQLAPQRWQLNALPLCFQGFPLPGSTSLQHAGLDINKKYPPLSSAEALGTPRAGLSLCPHHLSNARLSHSLPV